MCENVLPWQFARIFISFPDFHFSSMFILYIHLIQVIASEISQNTFLYELLCHFKGRNFPKTALQLEKKFQKCLSKLSQCDQIKMSQRSF